jgi:hypothetical protein
MAIQAQLRGMLQSSIASLPQAYRAVISLRLMGEMTTADIRPTLTANGGAMATVQFFIADGLFIGQIPQFVEQLMDLAAEADAASRLAANVP